MEKSVGQTILKNYMAVLRALHDLVFILDENYVVIDFYQPPLRKAYLPPENFLHKQVSACGFPANVTDLLEGALKAATSTGLVQSVDYSLIAGKSRRFLNANISAIYADDNLPAGYAMIVRDITDSVEHEKRYRSVMDKQRFAARSARFGIYEFDYKTGEYYWDEAMGHLFSCPVTSAEQLKAVFQNLIDPADYEALRTGYVNARKNGDDFHASFRVNIDGTTKFIETFASFQYDYENRFALKVTGIAIDVTEKKTAELAVQKSEELYRMLADNSTDLILLINLLGGFDYVSPSAKRLLGYSVDEIINQPPGSIIHPDDLGPLYDATIRKNLAGTSGFFDHYRIKAKDGIWHYFEATTQPIYNACNEVVRIISQSREVTDRVLAKQALRKSEEHYRLLADNIADMVVLMTPGFRRIYVSPSSYALIGYTPEELVEGQPLLNIFYSEEDRVVAQDAARRMARGEGDGIAQFGFRHKDGRRVTVEGIPKIIYDDNGETRYFLTTVRNVTRQVAAESALRKSEERYRMLADNIVDAVVLLLTPRFERVYVSPSCHDLTGYTALELINENNAFSMFYAEEDAAAAKAAALEILSGKNNIAARYCLRHKNGGRITVHSMVKGIRDRAGNLLHYLLSVRNITQQAAAEHALRHSEQQYRLLADHIVDMVALYDNDGKRLYVSPSSMQLLGYLPEEMTGHGSSDIMDPADLRYMRENVIEKAKTSAQDNFFLSVKLRHKDGHRLHAEVLVKAIRDENGTLSGFAATTRDVTAAILAKQALEQSEHRYRLVVDNMFDMIILYNASLQREYISPSSVRLIGYTPEEIAVQGIFAIVHVEDREGLKQYIHDHLRGQDAEFQYEFRARHKNGGWRFAQCVFTIIRDEQGQTVNLLGTFRDITAEKSARISLKDSEEKYRSLVEASENIITIMDEDGRYLFANEIACRYVNRSTDEVVGKNMQDFFNRETVETYVAKIRQVLHTRQKVDFESRVVVPDGKTVWLRNTFLPIYDSVSRAYAVMLCLVDITDLRVYSETLEIQNRELKQIAYLQSHIVRAPLANIEGLITVLDETAFSPENRLYIGLIKEAAGQLDAVIREIVTRSINVKQRAEQLGLH